MRIDFYGSLEASLNSHDGLSRLLNGQFWLGEETVHYEPRVATSTKIDMRVPAGGYVARTVIEGTGLELGEPTRLIGGSITSIKFYEGNKRLVAEFSAFDWDGKSLGDAATRANSGGSLSELRGLVLAEPVVFDASKSYHAMDIRMLGAVIPVTIVATEGSDLVYGAEAGDVIHGGSGQDYLHGLDGDDIINGGPGVDFFYGGDGADHLIGGGAPPGRHDFAVYTGYSLSLSIIDLREPSRNTGPAAGDTYHGITGVIGTSGPTELHGNAQDNSLNGLSGDDEIFGYGGDDYLHAAEAGTLRLVGGPGDDWLSTFNARYAILNGGAGNDTAAFGHPQATSQGQHADLTRTQTDNRDSVKTLVLIGIENITGTQYADDLRGDDGANRLDGGLGRDLLIGRGGADVLDGGDGKDRLRGGDGNDVLSGGKRPDRLEGGAGRDLLSGGEGPDVFIFAGSGTDGHRDRDVITDFEAGTDRLLLAERTIASVRRTDDGVRLLLDGTDGDAIDLIGLTKTQIDLLGSALFV